MTPPRNPEDDDDRTAIERAEDAIEDAEDIIDDLTEERRDDKSGEG